jgi:hypothetical protein
MPFRVDISVDQGTSDNAMWVIYDTSQTILADISDIVSGQMDIRASYGSPSIIFNANTANGNMELNVVTSTVTVNFANNSFAGLQFADTNADNVILVYDTRITDANLNTYCIATGLCTVYRAVTY